MTRVVRDRERLRSAEIRESYDAVAEQYASLFLGDLDQDPAARAWLARFTELAAPRIGVVVDLGCGPGHVVHHLNGLGLTTIGVDLSPGQIEQARTAFPHADFRLGDLTALDSADSSLGGIVSRYSLIHLTPSLLPDVFAEWMRTLEPGAPVLVSFFAAATSERHGAPFDHAVTTAFELFPPTVVAHLHDVGFVGAEVDVRPPPDGARPLDHATVLAARPPA
ncbi:MAG: class I SAM-dependent methyltransferase [Ilumatobacter sp.]|uniref:class I SAM-dependent DNA methyltransferase n=1 Tax=Ilumatobacter sp. TaxID=1967498 RepID=UPI003297F01A